MMTEQIREQLYILCMSACLGVIMAFAYDFLRIMRNIRKYRELYIWLQDIIYWMIFAFIFYKTMLYYNYGAIRGYAFLGIFTGMLVYYKTVSGFFVRGTSFIIKKIINSLLKILKFIEKPIKLIGSRIDKTIGKKLISWKIAQEKKELHKKEKRPRKERARETNKEEEATTEL